MWLAQQLLEDHQKIKLFTQGRYVMSLRGGHSMQPSTPGIVKDRPAGSTLWSQQSSSVVFSAVPPQDVSDIH